jgi:hypothetical protein
MAAPPGFDAHATVLQPGPSAPVQVMRGGARGSAQSVAKFSEEEEEILSQYQLGPGGKIADKFDDAKKEAFLKELKSGICAKGTGNLVIDKKDCGAVVEVLRALLRSSIRDGQRGGGFLDTIRGLVGSKKVMPMAAGGGDASVAEAVSTEKKSYSWSTSFKNPNDFTQQVNGKITELMRAIRENPTGVAELLNTYKKQIEEEENKYLAGVNAQLLAHAVHAITIKTELRRQVSPDIRRILTKFAIDILATMKAIEEEIRANEDAPSNENVDKILAGLPSGGGAAAVPGEEDKEDEEDELLELLPGVAGTRTNTGATGRMNTGAGTGLTAEGGAAASPANVTPVVEETLRSATTVAPLGRRTTVAGRTAEQQAVNDAKTALQAAETALATSGYEAHKTRPTWFRNNASGRSLPIHYNLTKKKYRGNAKAGNLMFSVYGDSPSNVIGKYNTVEGLRTNRNTKAKVVKNVETALTRKQQANAKAKYNRLQAQLQTQKEQQRMLEREAQEAKKAAQPPGLLSRLFKRGGSRKTRRAGRKTRRAERK